MLRSDMRTFCPVDVLLLVQGCLGLSEIVQQAVQDVSAALQDLGPLQTVKFWRRDELHDKLLTK